MPDINEYSRYFNDANFPYGPRVNGELSDIAETLDILQVWMDEPTMPTIRSKLQKAIERHSIENATKDFYEVLSAKLSAI
jgi:hypothetical protein